MTPVYSGGLVYEYSEEGTDYGLVMINGNSITETSDFTALQHAFSNVNPSGDGGYKSSGRPSKCPSQSSHWQVKDFTGEELPTIPEGAVKYMKSGAGQPAGLNGDGSQNAGGTSTGTAAPGSGAVSETASSSSIASANFRGETQYGAFFACAAAIFCSTLFGATML